MSSYKRKAKKFLISYTISLQDTITHKISNKHIIIPLMRNMQETIEEIEKKLPSSKRLIEIVKESKCQTKEDDSSDSEIDFSDEQESDDDEEQESDDEEQESDDSEEQESDDDEEQESDDDEEQESDDDEEQESDDDEEQESDDDIQIII